jgi:tape measure domain-containing protein
MSNNIVEIIIKASTQQAAAAIRALSRDVNTQLSQAGRVSSSAWASAGRSIASDIRGAASGVKGLLGHIMSLKTAIAGLAAGYVAKNIVETASGFEQMKISLDTITKGEGAKWFKDLNEWAMKMPVNTQAAIQSFIMMRAMGLEPTIAQMTTLVDTMSALGGNEETLSGIARALGQIMTKNKVSAEELMQLAERGVPVFEILRQKFGDVETSSLNAGEAVQAIFAGLEEKYGGQSTRIQSTWKGLTESLKGYWTEFARLMMDSGVMSWIEEKLGAIVAKFDEMYNSGELQEWANIIGTQIVAGLEATWTWLEDIYYNVTANWPEVREEFYAWGDSLGVVWEILKGMAATLIQVWDVADWIATGLEDAWGWVDRLIGRIEYFGLLGKGTEMIMEPKIKMSPPQPWKSGIAEMQADLEATGQLAVDAFDMSPVANSLNNIKGQLDGTLNKLFTLPGEQIYGAGLGMMMDSYLLGERWMGRSAVGASGLGSYAAGTDYVPRTGMYMLHKGEAVRTADENSRPGRASLAPNINIKGINISVSGANVGSPETLAAKLADALDRAIAQKIKYGRSSIAAALA